EDRLIQIGNWLRANGEAIYGTHQWRNSRQWSTGSIPKLEEKQFMGEYEIAKLVDSPPAGTARVEAFFTAKPGAVYAIVPRRSPEIVINNIERPVTATLVENGQQLPSDLAERRLTIRLPESLPHREAYAIKLAGAR